ncbi:MAG TPA: RsmD family RNA methyltransferase [Candidatus Dormibacteraeota bacterium]
MPYRSRRPIPRRAGAGARLTGGEAAGRKLLTEPGAGMRATTGLVRAACFNILGEQVLGAEVVDLFAGVGSLGLEALSRGAALVTFVEVQRGRARVIEANLANLGWEDRGRVVVADALHWIRVGEASLLQSRLLLLDPPYQDQGPQLCLDALGLLGKVAAAQAGWDPRIVAEHHRDLSVPAQVGALNCVRTARYGTSVLSFYRRLP